MMDGERVEVLEEATAVVQSGRCGSDQSDGHVPRYEKAVLVTGDVLLKAALDLE